MATRDDIEAWLAACTTGDRRAFGKLYSATSAKLFGICLRVLDNRAEAEEVLHDVYVKIWQNAGRYQANGLSPMTWLITIARNSAVDRLRKRRSPAASMEPNWTRVTRKRCAGPILTARPTPILRHGSTCR
jgi:RNA polymerase sigma-70 factor (ECF subfamily)